MAGNDFTRSIEQGALTFVISLVGSLLFRLGGGGAPPLVAGELALTLIGGGMWALLSIVELKPVRYAWTLILPFTALVGTIIINVIFDRSLTH